MELLWGMATTWYTNRLQEDSRRPKPDEIRQIFTNLLSNACKFTENGYISLAGRELEDRPGWVEFTVRDTSSNTAPKLRDANQTAASANARVTRGI